ncbi:uncharacterized protein LOC111283580 [Durio zibethinus]|uniref:Uncharacterized protein LOC111283580 n=1 Tax=Durio zibethinus TaxID=66656 RepID=A0A6P5XI80_DURZI|nr:uncharacterized protein LOC111283580 [Durio zibethinus]
MESSNRRLTLFEQMSAVDNGRNTLAGLTLEAVLGNVKRTEPPPTQNRTLLDIIRDDGSNKDKKSWKTLRDKLRLKRSVSAWTSSVTIRLPMLMFMVTDPSSCGAVRFVLTRLTRLEVGMEVKVPWFLARRDSVRFGHNPSQTDHDDSVDVSMPGDAPSRSFRPSNTRHHSTHSPSSNTAGNETDSSDDDSPMALERPRRLRAALEEERALSAREAVAAQEAEEAAENNSPPPTVAAEEPVRMSLMDLLEETDRQMGLSGSRYTVGDDDDYYKEEEKEIVVIEASRGIEYTCCVCMIRHKGAAFIPCGHTFCRLCSRELWVQRGSCPLCNGFILEILDIF